MEKNSNQIFEKLGEMAVDINWIKEDAKKKNGYITDLNKRVLDIEMINNKLVPEMYDFQKELRDELKRSKDWKGAIKNNPVIFISTVLIGAGAGTYLPLIWMWIKHMVK